MVVGGRHPRIDTLELHSLNRLTGARLARTEEHLLICKECRNRVSSFDSYHEVLKEALRHIQAEVHATEDGLIHNWVEVNMDDRYTARHRGPIMDGASDFPTEKAAWAHLRRLFRQMFPGHKCREHCSPRRRNR